MEALTLIFGHQTQGRITPKREARGYTEIQRSNIWLRKESNRRGQIIRSIRLSHYLRRKEERKLVGQK